MPDNDLVEICSETLRMGEFTGDEGVRDDSFIELTLLQDVTNFLQIYADSLINITYNHIVMNRIKPLWVESIFLTILIFFLCACSTTTGNKTPSAQAGTGANGATAMEDQIAQAVFQTINESRAADGLPPLKWSTALANSARQHDPAVQAAETLSHQLQGEDAVGDRARK